MSASEKLRQLEQGIPGFRPSQHMMGDYQISRPQAEAINKAKSCLPEIRELFEQLGIWREAITGEAVVNADEPVMDALAAFERKLEQADHELLITNDTSSSLVVGEQA